jgi:hypothetical protein
MNTTELSQENNNDIYQQNSQEISDNMRQSDDYTKNKIISDPEENPNKIYKKKIPKNEGEDVLRYVSYSSTQKNKSRSTEINNDVSEFTTNKKLRNTMSGLNNNKLKFQSGLIDIILKVERENVNHYLKGDLAEMYQDINKNNGHFKNNVFLANIDYFENKTGNLDKKPIIPYNCKEDVSFKLNNYPTTNEIIEKFTERTKNYQGDN